MSRKRGYDHNESNDDQPSAAVESSSAPVELESTRRMSLRTENAAKYSEMGEEVVANLSLISETDGNNAEAITVTTSNSHLANGAEMRAAAESTEKATAKTPKSTSKSTRMTPKESPVNSISKAKMNNRADSVDDEEKSQGLRRRVYK